MNADSSSSSQIKLIPVKLAELVERFDQHLDTYSRPHYNEAQLRQEFVDPFFRLLGWDVDNEQGWAEAYKEVIHEESISVEGAVKAPDYSFRIGGTRKFFVETKKPSWNLKQAKEPAFQLRRYAWSAKLPLSVLTNFEELALYDCRQKPANTDAPSSARVMYVTFDEYAGRWSEIQSILSKQAILKGSFDAYALSVTDKKGTAEVDQAFLAEIEVWRTSLASNLALRNPELTQRELNFAVQRTIDRLIFLRICEARGLEEYGQLQKLLGHKDAYKELCQFIYLRADERYNSGLFHFSDEPGRTESPDHLTRDLKIDDKTLKEIIRHLYYPESPYEFSVLPADILGHVYEQFLGKVVRLTVGHHAKIEEKPEVKKAGGVYYTPTYIVEYIVENTLGRLVAGKSPRQVGGETSGTAGNPIRICDPACGSGSFLIEAYQFLLDWYRESYISDDPQKWTKGKTPRLYEGVSGDWLLTTAERKRILLTHIYGVDIDAQAVEVTKLSLLLKVLEGETKEHVQHRRLFHDRALPDLGENIKCGNSLIAPDFYLLHHQKLMDEEDFYRINPFSWEEQFPHVLGGSDPGFDVVLGNPPYLSVDDVWGKGDERQRYLKFAYPHVYNDKTDVLFYFLARALEIGKGEVSFIVSRAFLEAYKADKLRGSLAEQADVREVVDFRNFYVFPKVGITTAILAVTKREHSSMAEFFRLLPTTLGPPPLSKLKVDPTYFERVEVPQDKLGSESWSFANVETQAILDKIDQGGQPIGSILTIGQGMQTGRNNVFGRLPGTVIAEWGLTDVTYRLRARNSDIDRYLIRRSDEVLLYLEDIERFEDLPSKVQDHLKAHEKTLKSRAAYERGDCLWWKFTWPLHKEHFKKKKLYAPYLATTNRFALDDDNEFLGLTDTTVLYDAGQAEDLKYIMAVLNSKLLTFRFKFIGKLKSAGIYEYFWNSVSKLPLRRIEFNVEHDVELHDEIVTLATHASDARHAMEGSKTEQDRELHEKRFRLISDRIDQLVYQAFGMSDDEVIAIESSI